MSNNKCIRSDEKEDEEEDSSVDDTTDGTLEKIAKMKELVDDTLFHDTYCRLFLKYLEMRCIVSSVVLISKYHNNLVFSHPLSYSLCKTISSYDYGSFVTNSRFTKRFGSKRPKITDARSLIKELYVDLSSYFGDEDSKDGNVPASPPPSPPP